MRRSAADLGVTSAGAYLFPGNGAGSW